MDIDYSSYQLPSDSFIPSYNRALKKRIRSLSRDDRRRLYAYKREEFENSLLKDASKEELLHQLQNTRKHIVLTVFVGIILLIIVLVFKSVGEASADVPNVCCVRCGAECADGERIYVDNSFEDNSAFVCPSCFREIAFENVDYLR